jgi:hypothetical protein
MGSVSDRCHRRVRYPRRMDRVDWDGAKRVGPIAVGMTLEQVQAAMPGYSEVDDHEGDDDAPNYYWVSDELGLIAVLRDAVVWQIMAGREFLVDGVDLIGMPAADAVSLAGGEVAREDWSREAFVETASGIELGERDGAIFTVVVPTSELIPD